LLSFCSCWGTALLESNGNLLVVSVKKTIDGSPKWVAYHGRLSENRDSGVEEEEKGEEEGEEQLKYMWKEKKKIKRVIYRHSRLKTSN